MKPRLPGLILGVLIAPATAVAADMPAPLTNQIERVAELQSDGFAVEYPDARMTQQTRSHDDKPLALVVFTLEGFGGGNNHTQYLAAFQRGTDREGDDHYQLIDVIPIAGKGWRAVPELNARTTHDPRSGETVFTLDVVENLPGDPMNFPTRKSTTRVLLKSGRLSELPAPEAAG